MHVCKVCNSVMLNKYKVYLYVGFTVTGMVKRMCAVLSQKAQNAFQYFSISPRM